MWRLLECAGGGAGGAVDLSPKLRHCTQAAPGSLRIKFLTLTEIYIWRRIECQLHLIVECSSSLWAVERMRRTNLPVGHQINCRNRSCRRLMRGETRAAMMCDLIGLDFSAMQRLSIYNLLRSAHQSAVMHVYPERQRLHGKDGREIESRRM